MYVHLYLHFFSLMFFIGVFFFVRFFLGRGSAIYAIWMFNSVIDEGRSPMANLFACHLDISYSFMLISLKIMPFTIDLLLFFLLSRWYML